VSSYDVLLAELARRHGALAPRPAAGIFASCAGALRGELLAWLDISDDPDVRLLDVAVAAAYGYASGDDPPGLPGLLASLEARTPPGEASNGVSPQFALDCWICADSAIRIAVDPAFEWGPVIEYALEPVVTVTTEDLHGVSQLGSEPEEERKLQDILDDARVREAVGFLRWAAQLADGADALAREDLDTMSVRATALIARR
jgi:hypothetical protein